MNRSLCWTLQEDGYTVNANERVVLSNLYKIIMLDFKAYCQMMVTDMRVIQRLRHSNCYCHHCLCQTYGLLLHSSVSSKLSFTLKDYLDSLVIYIFHLDIWRQTLFFLKFCCCCCCFWGRVGGWVGGGYLSVPFSSLFSVLFVFVPVCLLTVSIIYV